MPQGSRSSFEHQPLHHERDIRLLRLTSGSRIQGELLSCALESAPRFVALSYTWGYCGAGDYDLTRSEEFWFSTGGMLRISHNLASWIQTHGINVDCPVWIDQICINQLDFSEREAQVRLMVDIYRRASKIYAWLGPGKESTTSALQILDQAGRALTPMSDAQGYSTPPEDYFTSGFPRPDRAWEDVRSLFENRTWFTRVWVQQEIIVSNLEEIFLQCGTETIKWAHVETLAQALFNGAARLNLNLREHVLKAAFLNSSATPMLMRLSNLSDFRSSITRRSNILSILTNFRGCGASDPRDMIFALAGMATDKLNSSFSPNYSLPLKVIYTSVMEYLIRDYGIEVLTDAGLMHKRHHTIPSWVVDWSFPRAHVSIFRGYDRYVKRNASISSSIIRVENDRLIMKGFVFDSIRALSHPLKEILSDIHFNKEGAQGLLSWYYDVVEVATSSLLEDTESDLYERIWCIIAYSSPLVFRAFSDWYDKAIEYLELLKVYDFDKAQFDKDSNGQELESFTERSRILYDWGLSAEGRRFCVTESGRFGLVPEQADIGDVFFSNSDQNLTFVGRSAGGELHLLVGDGHLEDFSEYSAFFPADLPKTEIYDIMLV